MKLTLQPMLALVLACGVTLCLSPAARAADPAPVAPSAPSPAPSFPGAFGAFAPSLSGTAPGSSAPVLAEWTRSAAPGDTVILTGGQLTSFTNTSVGRDTQFFVYGQSGAGGVRVEADIQRLSGDQVALTLPSSLPTNSMYFVWPKNQSGTGRPAMLNRTDAWWVGPNKANPGNTISVFGRNLGSGTSSWAYLQSSSGSGQWLTATACNGYKADFVLPSGLTAGTYQVWAHNGLGQQYGWGKPITLTVSAAYAWTATQFNVKNYGAQGNGTTDDTSAINAAITAAAGSPGSTVYFPAGTYILGDTIGGARSNMRFAGAGKSTTKLLASSSFIGSYGMFVGAFTNVEVSDITLDTGSNMGGVLGPTIMQIRNSSGVKFTNVKFTQQNVAASAQSAQTSPVDFQGSDHFWFTGCDFVQTNGSFPGNSTQVFFDQCAFYGINDCNALLYIWGGGQISLTNSTGADFNNTDVRANGNGWAQGRWISGRGGGEGSPREIYFAGNTTTDLAVRPAYTANQNTGEQFMFEGLDTLFRGSASSGTANTVTLSGGSSAANQCVTIVGGKGIGQSRLVTSAAGSTLTVEEPWAVIPDSTSILAVGGFLTHAAVINNTFDGKSNITADTASAGIEPYGGTNSIVVANNTFHDLRYGIYNSSLTNSLGGSQAVLSPNFFNDFRNNGGTNCYYGYRNNVAHWEAPAITYDTAMLGNTWRGNSMTAQQDGFSFWSYGIGSTTTIAMNTYQGNTINAYRCWASDTFPGMQNQVLVGNQMQSSGPVGASLNISQTPVLRVNTWTPSGSAYSGTPTGIVEAPRRVQHVDLTTGTSTVNGQFTVWNSGTGSLSWTASTATSWLTLPTSSGTIANENSSGTLSFTANAAGLAAGDYEGVISVTGAGKTQQVTVTLTVTNSLPLGTGTGLKGEYYSGTAFNTLIKSQTDPQVNFDWASGSPKNLDGSTMSSVGPDSFSVRWTGQVQAIESGSYTFTTTTDDGVRLYISDTTGTPLIDHWVNQGSTAWSGTITLTAGQKYNIRMDYFDDTSLAEARLSWLRPGAGSAQIIPQSQLYPTMGTPSGSGSITRELWTGVDGNSIVAYPFNTTPTSVDTLTSLEGPTDWADQYATRLRGYITAPFNGQYTFWIAGDDSTELWLSTNDSATNKSLIAYSTQWTNSREWNKYTSQKSAAVTLTAGQRYYVEILQKEGGGGDNLAVGWLKPGETGTIPSQVVPGSALSPLP